MNNGKTTMKIYHHTSELYNNNNIKKNLENFLYLNNKSHNKH